MVFISHAHEDHVIAGKVCAGLEAAGIRCWIAPRDVPVGLDWPEAIVEAVKGSQAVVLIFSAHTNNSRQVVRELDLADKQKIRVIPFRVEEVEPTGSLRYFLGSTHWLDVAQQPFPAQLHSLREALGVQAPAPEPEPEKRFPWLLTLGAGLLVAGLVWIGIARTSSRVPPVAASRDTKPVIIPDQPPALARSPFRWSQWDLLEGTTDVAPSAIVQDGAVHVFSKGINVHEIYEKVFQPFPGTRGQSLNSGGTWTGWYKVAGMVTTDRSLSAAPLREGQRYLFARNEADGRLYSTVGSDNASTHASSWSGWVPEEPWVQWGPAASSSEGAVSVAIVDRDSLLSVKTFGTGAEGSWQRVPVSFTIRENPALVTDTGGRRYLFANDQRNQIHMNRSDDGRTWLGWTAVDGDGYGPVAAVARGTDVILFAPRAQRVAMRVLSSDEWTAWIDLPDDFSTDTAVAAAAIPQALFLVGKDTDRRLFWRLALIDPR